MWDLVPWPNPGLLRWVHWVLATGPSGKSLFFVFNVTLLRCQTPLPPFNLTADHRELSWVRPCAPGEGPGEAFKAAMRLIPCPRQGHKQAQPDQEWPTDSGLHTCVLLQNTNFGVVSFKAIVDITERKGNSCSVVSDSLQPHELQHTRPPCPSPTPGVHPNPCPLSQWCHPVISSSVVPFSSCPQSLPASESFQMSQLFASGCQSIGVSASTSVLPVNTQYWSPLVLKP